MVALFLIIDGVLRIASGFVHETENKVPTILFGIALIILGAWLWSGLPVSGVAIGFFVGLQLLFAGIAWIVIGLAARSVHNKVARAEAAA